MEWGRPGTSIELFQQDFRSAVKPGIPWHREIRIAWRGGAKFAGYELDPWRLSHQSWQPALWRWAWCLGGAIPHWTLGHLKAHHPPKSQGITVTLDIFSITRCAEPTCANEEWYYHDSNGLGDDFAVGIIIIQS